MKRYDCIIIGSGLGGLQCAYILARSGRKVCVLEQGEQIGGALQTFRRGKSVFDTGFHYVGGLDHGQPLNKLFDYFDLLDLPWHRLDDNCFDEIIIDGKSYKYAMGYDNFAKVISSYFPHHSEKLHIYTEFLKEVNENIFTSLQREDSSELYESKLFTCSAYDYLNELFDGDPEIINVLSGASLKFEADIKTLPLYVFAQINSSYISSSWRLKGGGMKIALKLAESVKLMGGEIITNAEVTEIAEGDKGVEYVKVNTGEKYYADNFISDIHPAATLSLINESRYIRKIYRKRITSLENSFGMFTANIRLKKDMLKYRNNNIYIYSNIPVWQINDSLERNEINGVLISYSLDDSDNGFASAIDILTPVRCNDFESWKESKVMRRGADYETYKREMADMMIDFVGRYMPELKTCVDKVYTSTPLTYRDYTSTYMGSAYGIKKDCNNLMQTMLTPRTPIPNLFMTGQNLNLHGILGVSMTSVVTCKSMGIDINLK